MGQFKIQSAFEPQGDQPKAIDALTAGEDWSCHSAKFSADGDSLYCLIEPNTENVYELTEIGRFDWADGTVAGGPDIITASFDRSIGDMAIARHGRTVFVTANDAGRVRLFAVPAAGGRAGPSRHDGPGGADAAALGSHVHPRLRDHGRTGGRA